jgi:hypothetical protein
MQALGNSHQRLIRIAKVKLCDSLGNPGTGNVSSLRIVSEFGLCNKCIIRANPNSDQLIVANFGSFGAADSKDQPAKGVRGAPSGFLRARPRVGLDESDSPFLSASPLHEEFCQETKSKTQPSCSHPVPTGFPGWVRSRFLLTGNNPITPSKSLLISRTSNSTTPLPLAKLKETTCLPATISLTASFHLL